MSFGTWSVHSLSIFKQFATSVIRMPRLSAEERGRALGMFEVGDDPVRIARHFECSKAVPSNLIRRHRETGNFKDQPRSGRPCVTSPGQDQGVSRNPR